MRLGWGETHFTPFHLGIKKVGVPRWCVCVHKFYKPFNRPFGEQKSAVLITAPRFPEALLACSFAFCCHDCSRENAIKHVSVLCIYHFHDRARDSDGIRVDKPGQGVWVAGNEMAKSQTKCDPKPPPQMATRGALA